MWLFLCHGYLMPLVSSPKGRPGPKGNVILPIYWLQGLLLLVLGGYFKVFWSCSFFQTFFRPGWFPSKEAWKSRWNVTTMQTFWTLPCVTGTPKGSNLRSLPPRRWNEPLLLLEEPSRNGHLEHSSSHLFPTFGQWLSTSILELWIHQRFWVMASFLLHFYE